MTTNLGTLKKIDPRTAWPKEASDFTPWLSKNIGQLGDLLDLDLELVESESEAGDFSIDILAKDVGNDRNVVIENQLEQTDHTHLGQIITYAAYAKASIVVWVCREFREEHRLAIDWLNQGMGAEGTRFFGVVVELVQIDDSKPAAHFKLVASPNEWSRTARKTREAAAGGELTEKQLAYMRYFQRLIDELREKHRFSNARASQPASWYSFSSGVSGFTYSASFARQGRIRAEIYFGSADGERNWKAFKRLRDDAARIEKEFGEKLEWEELEGKVSCRVACYGSGTIDDAQDKLDEYRAWMIDRLLRFKKVFGPRLAAAKNEG